ncbi:acetolactate synthase small subunit [Anseongella ginsenosidimutans]|uniref:Acetolactate synthase small subunit n=1 Tax=Anseongella ginsenosidimutans TaxID=496056 RepID=A0A4R3KVA1_9SPHI|nr:acetolactate synthase small subunit [Anseongella ginsenosidimutans]QEC53161.1 acetolactate synthase small subunit [Anseongella ginsenosidimutans]TCS87787.1 acetolactate synthase small subunit [Anseongella ginsenosidimutans]
MEKLYTICIFTENTLGLLNRISGIFTRRRINIESLSVSETERKGISRFTIVFKSDEREKVEKIVRQIRKIIEVLAVFGYEDPDLVFNELAFFKLDTKNAAGAKQLLEGYKRAKVLFEDEQILIIEKAGTEEEIYSFFKQLKPYGILEFVRSGRIALSRSEKGLAQYLPEAEWAYNI